MNRNDDPTALPLLGAMEAAIRKQMRTNDHNALREDTLRFSDDPENATLPRTDLSPWKILVVDDEEDIHRVTRMVLSGYHYRDRPLALLHADSATEALDIIREQADIALILLDVIMETDSAGLDLVDSIRRKLGNDDVRILVRTGQPGMFDQYQVAQQYAINGFCDKASLTAEKLFASITTLLREYDEQRQLRAQQRGMAQKIEQLKSVANLMQQTPLATLMLDHLCRITALNAAFVEVTGFTMEYALGCTPDFLKPEQCDTQFLQATWENLLESGTWEGELECATRAHGDILVRLSAVVLREPGSDQFEVAVQFTDVTRIKAQEQEFLRLATRDPLTSLPNRNLFLERVNHAITQAQRSGSGFALLFLDLDYFKNVNDQWGHKFGDQLLKEVGQRLQRCLRRSDTVARYGGDEFTAILANTSDRRQIEQVAGKINRTLAQPYQLHGKEARIACSIGIARYPEDAANADDLLHFADLAMYAAKHRGRGGYGFYDPDAAPRER